MSTVTSNLRKTGRAVRQVLGGAGLQRVLPMSMVVVLCGVVLPLPQAGTVAAGVAVNPVSQQLQDVEGPCPTPSPGGSIQPRLRVQSPYIVQNGDTITVWFDGGLDCRAVIRVILDPGGIELATLQADYYGRVPWTDVAIPSDLAPGDYKLSATYRSEPSRPIGGDRWLEVVPPDGLGPCPNSAYETLIHKRLRVDAPEIRQAGDTITVWFNEGGANYCRRPFHLFLNPGGIKIATLWGDISGNIPRTGVTLPSDLAPGKYSLGYSHSPEGASPDSVDWRFTVVPGPVDVDGPCPTDLIGPLNPSYLYGDPPGMFPYVIQGPFPYGTKTIPVRFDGNPDHCRAVVRVILNPGGIELAALQADYYGRVPWTDVTLPSDLPLGQYSLGYSSTSDPSITFGRGFSFFIEPEVAPTVTITGSPQVGQVLTAAVVDNPGGTVTWQWSRYTSANTSTPVAAGQTYTPVADDVGLRLQVRATIDGPGTYSAGPSATTFVIPANAPTVAISGTAQFGRVLTAHVANHPGGIITYQWYVDSVPVAGATNATYAPVAADVGLMARVEATARGPSAYTVTISDTAGPIMPAADPTVAISGLARVGETLTSTVTGQPTGSTIAYAWFVDGAAAPIATTPIYRIQPGDVGKAIMVQAYVTGPGAFAWTGSAQTGPIATVQFVPKAAISGTAEVGATLTGAVSGYPNGSTVKYQWLRGGTAISGATAATYKVAAADKGQQITLRVVVSIHGVVKTATSNVLNVPTDADPLVTGMAQVVLSPSLAGGKYGDVLVVDQSGNLWRFAGKSTPLGAKTSLGTGWNTSTVYAPGDWNNDGKNDVIAVDQMTGRMFLYPGDGKGGIGAKKQIGQGWGGYRVIPAGDLTGDGNADLLAIKESTGDLYLYAGDGKGGFKYPYPKVGNGWTGFDPYAAGDVNKDGKADLLSIDAKGDLYFYAGRGDGTFARKIQVGYGWKGYKLAAGADLNGDGFADIVSLDSKGDLYFYAARGGGLFAKKIKIGTGF